ncbi:unnamed protein product, partial [Ceratitis capitata]
KSGMSEPNNKSSSSTLKFNDGPTDNEMKQTTLCQERYTVHKTPYKFSKTVEGIAKIKAATTTTKIRNKKLYGEKIMQQ